ncbi:MAG: beta-1,6-N-acetylglucosaminyltransferase [Comamonadaceae bacterium]|nr:beta-1,6-N-acetylglucosaminyltransferase [Comamonadaceae bacterium]
MHPHSAPRSNACSATRRCAPRSRGATPSASPPRSPGTPCSAPTRTCCCSGASGRAAGRCPSRDERRVPGSGAQESGAARAPRRRAVGRRRPCPGPRRREGRRGAVPRRARRRPRVDVVAERHAVNWGGFGMVRATLALCRAALAGPGDRLVLLSGMDLPLRPVEAIEAVLADDVDRIDLLRLPHAGLGDGGGLDRVRWLHGVDLMARLRVHPKLLAAAHSRLLPWFPRRPPPGLTLRMGGPVVGAASRQRRARAGRARAAPGDRALLRLVADTRRVVLPDAGRQRRRRGAHGAAAALHGLVAADAAVGLPARRPEGAARQRRPVRPQVRHRRRRAGRRRGAGAAAALKRGAEQPLKRR